MEVKEAGMEVKVGMGMMEAVFSFSKQMFWGGGSARRRVWEGNGRESMGLRRCELFCVHISFLLRMIPGNGLALAFSFDVGVGVVDIGIGICMARRLRFGNTAP